MLSAHAVVSYVHYLGKLFWPAHLAVFYPHPRAVNLPALLVSIALLAGATILAVMQRRARPYIIVGWLWFLGTLVPVIGLVQVGQQAMADRFTYIPYVG